MMILEYNFSPEEYTYKLNEAKDLMLSILLKEKKITEKDYKNYLEKYAIILVNRKGFLNFCKSIFKKEDLENSSYPVIVKVC